MPTKRIAQLLVALVAFTLFLALPAAAGATIAFVRGAAKPTVYTANDDGTNVRRVAFGFDPKLSADGSFLVYSHEIEYHEDSLKLAPVATGVAGHNLAFPLRNTSEVAFSPNAKLILAVTGPFTGEKGEEKLVRISRDGVEKTIDRGHISGFGFSPDGKWIVYAKAANERFPPRVDVYRVSVKGGQPIALTHDHRSESPLWGPTGKIAFVKLIEGSKRKYAPKNELYLMNPDGTGTKRLTHTNVGQLLQGLTPTAWSADGTRLLAQFGGQDTSYAVGVEVATGAQHPIGEAIEAGLIGTALSPDGETVYGAEGGFEPGGRHAVVSVPFAGGEPRTLIANGFEPSFSF